MFGCRLTFDQRPMPPVAHLTLVGGPKACRSCDVTWYGFDKVCWCCGQEVA